MKLKKNKKVSTFAMILLLTVSGIVATVPLVTAHTPPWTIQTYSYIVASPSPVGVGQDVFVVFWVDWVPPGAGGVGGDRWRNLDVQITKPDGSKQNLGPYISDPIGGGFALYKPDQVGVYTFEFKFPGQTPSMYGPTGEISVNPTLWDYINDTFLPSSATATLTVQSQPVTEPPNYPLPTEYWTRPIEGENTAWASIASNYLYPFGAAYQAGSMRFQPDGVAPNSPHVMWTKPLQFGGVVGGSDTAIPGITYYSGLSYESRFTNPLIMYGRLYYRVPFGNNAQGGGYACVDLKTGETFWVRNYTAYPSFASLYDYESMNQHGVIPNGYLWATASSGGVTTWMALDGMTGEWLFNLTNVPSGQISYADDGSITIYQLDATKKWLALWNTSAAPDGPLVLTPGTTTNAFQYRPIGKNANMSKAYTWNVTIPTTVPAGSAIRKVIPDDMLLVSTNTMATGARYGSIDYTVSAVSLKPTSRGQLLWTKSYPAPTGDITRQWGPVDSESRVFTMNDKETMQWLGYDLDSGTLLWGPLGDVRDFNYYPTVGMGGSGPAGFVAYRKLYTGGYGGEFFCYDMKTGALLWEYNNTSSAHETPWGNYPTFPAAIADGKVYLYSGEHSPNAPQYKGSRVRCVNATTGEELWTMLGWGAVGGFADEGWPVADGSIVYYNAYDMQIYCLGKGPSATTVSAPNIAVPQGSAVLVQGNVLDIAAGTEQNEQAARFPYGVPAVSDGSMGEWMEYVYMQKPKPTDVVGVKVHVTAIDPNGNFQDIGTAVSDDSGFYSLLWTPPVPGKYVVTASFEGSGSYYGSSAKTAFAVSQAAAPIVIPTPTVAPTAPIVQPTQTPAQTPVSPSTTQAVTPPTSAEPTTTYIAIGVAVVVIVAVAAALVLRRRK